MKSTDVAIIGGGVAGMSAALYARRFNLDVIIFDGYLGGNITKTQIVENYPGFIKISGIELAQKIREHTLSYKPMVINKRVEKLEKKGGYFVIDVGDEKIKSKAVIFATGTKWKRLNVKGEAEFNNKGVSYCSLCDGFLYKNKKVAVVGAGNSAVKEAIVLSELAGEVYLVAKKEIHPDSSNREILKKAKNVEVIQHVDVLEILGDTKVKGLKLNKKHNGKNVLDVDGIFVSIGHDINSELAKEIGVKTNTKGEIITDKFGKTNIKGFFAAGDVTDKSFKQAIAGVAEGCIAANSAYEYITKEHMEVFSE